MYINIYNIDTKSISNQYKTRERTNETNETNKNNKHNKNNKNNKNKNRDRDKTTYGMIQTRRRDFSPFFKM